MYVAHLTTLSIGLTAVTPMGPAPATPETLMARMRDMVHADSVQVMNEEARFSGVIRRIDEEGKTVTLDNADGEIVTVSYDDDTQFTLNGEASTREQALEVGRDATVVHTDKRATRIDVTQGEA